MTVIILEKVPASVRGELTRWLLEVASGVFVGTVSALVRDLLWKKVMEKSKNGRCILVHRMNNEQGFAVRMHGDSKRAVRDVEGLTLIAVKNAAWEAFMQDQKERQERMLRRALEVPSGGASSLTD
jgi:CRISPR-associated protein Cas2